MKAFRFASLLALGLTLCGTARAATVTFADFGSLAPNTSFSATPGASFNIDIIGLEFTELSGGEINLAYDESLVMINSVTVDPYWDFSPDGGSDSGINTWGTIAFDAFVNAPAAGSFRIATISMTALAEGVSMLDILDSSLFFSSTAQLSPIINNATVSVSAVPLPAAIWLMLGGVSLLATFGRRRPAA